MRSLRLVGSVGALAVALAVAGPVAADERSVPGPAPVESESGAACWQPAAFPGWIFCERVEVRCWQGMCAAIWILDAHRRIGWERPQRETIRDRD